MQNIIQLSMLMKQKLNDRTDFYEKKELLFEFYKKKIMYRTDNVFYIKRHWVFSTFYAIC